MAVQRRNRPAELLGITPADAPGAAWTLDCAASAGPDGTDFAGPWIQGPRGGRFIYLSWGTTGDGQPFTMFRRAKLWLTAVPPEVAADAARLGLLIGRLGLTDGQGGPLCASVRPPAITWSAARP